MNSFTLRFLIGSFLLGTVSAQATQIFTAHAGNSALTIGGNFQDYYKETAFSAFNLEADSTCRNCFLVMDSMAVDTEGKLDFWAEATQRQKDNTGDTNAFDLSGHYDDGVTIGMDPKSNFLYYFNFQICTEISNPKSCVPLSVPRTLLVDFRNRTTRVISKRTIASPHFNCTVEDLKSTCVDKKGEAITRTVLR